MTPPGGLGWFLCYWELYFLQYHVIQVPRLLLEARTTIMTSARLISKKEKSLEVWIVYGMAESVG